MRVRRIAAAMAVVLGCILSGCASPGTNGPALVGGGSGEICTANQHGQTMLMGDLLEVSGTSATRLDSAYLQDERNVRLEAAWVVPVEPRQTYVTMGTLEESSMAQGLWASKHPLADYEVIPGEIVNVILEIEVIDPLLEASTTGMAIEYSSGSSRFVTKAKMSYRFLTTRCLPN